MARALVLATSLMLGHLAVAAAEGKTSKVTIETDPPGAKVYFGLKEDGEVCTTPCTVDAPIGETTIIIEAENRRPLMESLVVRKKAARPIKVSYKLAPARGTLVIEGGDGAIILIDDQAQGKAPKRFEDLEAGAHHVVLEKNGKKLYDQFVEVEVDREATVALSPAGQPLRGDGAGDDDEVVITDHDPATRPPSTAQRREHTAVVITGAMDVAFRQFTYKGNLTPREQRNDRQVGQVLAGPIVELWPTTLLGVRRLPGLSLYARFELAVNKQNVTVKDSMTGMVANTSLTTAWRNLEISVRHRWRIKDAATVEVGTGYTEDRIQFDGDPDDIAVVPDAVYKAVRLGGSASLLLGSLEPYVALENRIVLSGGAMEKRYTLGTSVNGVRGVLGGVTHLGKIELRLEAALTRYAWTFRPDTSDRSKASGGSDFIQNVTVAVGYAY